MLQVERYELDSRWSNWIFSVYLILPHYGPGIGSASNRNEYQKSSWECKARPARKTVNLTALCEPIIYKLWDPRRLITL
jgi:hypothetical protein